MTSWEIGLVATGKRRIKDGKEYDSFFPKSEGRDQILQRNASVNDTVSKMAWIVGSTLKDTEKIAPKLKGRTVKETCENIWKFLYHNIQYELDEKGIEQLRRPARAWRDRKEGIDCDCFSIFASSLLCNNGIDNTLRVTRYDGNWQHVYVIVPNNDSHRGYYIIDPVVDRFNYEKPFRGKMDYNIKKMAQMNGIPLAYLSGPGDDMEELLGIILGTDFQEIEQMEGLGQTPSEDAMLNALYNHLVKTRNQLQKNPNAFKTIADPGAYLKMIDYALEYWNTPRRDEALSVLEEQEKRMLQMQAMQGFSGQMEGFWDKVKKAAAAVKTTVKKAATATTKFVVRNVKSAVKDVKKVATNVAKAVVRFNPITAAARATILSMMKANTSGIAGRLKWAYATPQQAAAKRISPTEQQKAKAAIAKIEAAFGFNTSASAANLKQAIVTGKAGGFAGGLGIPVAAAAQAAGPVAELLNKILSAIGLGPKESTGSEAFPQASLVPYNTSLPQALPSDPSGSTGSKLMEWVKANPAKTAIGAVVIGTTLVLALSPKARKATGLGAVSQKRKVKRKKSAVLSGTDGMGTLGGTKKPSKGKRKTIVLK